MGCTTRDRLPTGLPESVSPSAGHEWEGKDPPGTPNQELGNEHDGWSSSSHEW